MTKICIEVCIISAHGLRHSSLLLKPRWFSVGWIDPNNKYCTKIDNSRSSNPTWRTKFSAIVDDVSSNAQGMSLTIEVYRKGPIFSREKLQGAAIILLKDFFAKFANDMEASRSGVEKTGSFQLRKRKSGKPQGFVDISVRISEERERVASYSGINGGYRYPDHQNEIQLAIEDGPVLPYQTQHQRHPNGQSGGYTRTSDPYSHPTPHPSNYPNPSGSGTGYHRPPTPPPPPPPSNAGFLPTLFPGTSRLPPPTGPSEHSEGPGFGMGLGAGALAAGAMIFGDDFMLGSSFPSGFDGGSLGVSTDTDYVDKII